MPPDSSVDPTKAEDSDGPFFHEPKHMAKPNFIKRKLSTTKLQSNPASAPEFSIEFLDQGQKERLTKAFSLFDKDGSGKISLREMVDIFRLLGNNPSELELDSMVKTIDKNHDGMVDFQEFAHVWWEREKENLENEWETELEFAFRLFDTDRNGMLSVTELTQKLTTTGVPMTIEEVREMLEDSDVNCDGLLSLDEFKAMKCWQSHSSGVL